MYWKWEEKLLFPKKDFGRLGDVTMPSPFAYIPMFIVDGVFFPEHHVTLIAYCPNGDGRSFAYPELGATFEHGKADVEVMGWSSAVMREKQNTYLYR